MARRDERSPASSRVVESPAIHRSSAGPGMAVHRQPVVQDDIVERIWRLFCSMRLALILILVITAAVFVGTLLDQTPGALSPSDYASWLSRARLKYGNFTDLLSTTLASLCRRPGSSSDDCQRRYWHAGLTEWAVNRDH